MIGGLRGRVIVQARDVPQLEWQVHSGLPVGSEESAVFRRMLVDAHDQMEGLFNARHRPSYIQVHAIAGSANHGKTVRFREVDHGVIILLAGTKPGGELFHREELAIRRAVGIVEFLQQVL